MAVSKPKNDVGGFESTGRKESLKLGNHLMKIA